MSEKQTKPDDINTSKSNNNTNNKKVASSENENSVNNSFSSDEKIRRKKKRRSKESIERKIKLQKEQLRKKRITYSLILGCIVLAIGGYYYYTKQYNPSSNQVSVNPVSNNQNNEPVDNFVTSPKSKANMLDVVTEFYNWTPEQQYALKDAILKHTVNPDFYKAANDNKNTMSTLWQNKDNNSDFMSSVDFSLYKTGYPQDNTIGVQFNRQGFVDNIQQDSPAYNYGIRLGWKLLRINGQIISYVPQDSSSIEQQISLHDSVWLSRSGSVYSFSKIPLFPAIGSIAEGWIQGNILSIRIYNMTNKTPGRIYQILKQNLDKKPNLMGVVLDLRSSSDSFSGLPESTWLLNNQKETAIGILYDRNNQSYTLMAKPLPFQTDPGTIQRINRLKKIVAVNGITGGSFELLANAITQQPNSELRGQTTANKNIFNAYYLFGEHTGAKISSYHVRLPDNQKLPLNPKNSVNFYVLDSLYQIKKN